MLRSLLFTVLMFITVVPYACLVVIFGLVNKAFAFRFARAWGQLVDRMAGALCGLHYVVEGRENFPEQSSVVMSKHSSAYETIMLLVIVPRHSWVLKRELIWLPFFGWALWAMRAISIDRSAGSGAVQQVLAQGCDRLARGMWVVIFPEGTRMPPGETRRYGMSGVLLAQRAGVPIVPIAHNAGDFWPRRGWRKRAGKVRFVIGPSIDATGREPREVNAEVQAWIEAKVSELRVEAGHMTAQPE
ncbi:MAG: lysophospholipid acyltransferase family protein [Gammaproteobacteria bacterium]